jgi:hypothetical protein
LNKFIEPKFDYGNNIIPTTSHMKFLGVTIDCTLSWSNHIELLTSKLNSVCYLNRNGKPYMSVSILRMIYHSFFHSIVSLGIIFGGNSHHSITIFKMQKKVLRIIVGCRNRESCRGLFKQLNILPLISQHTYSLLMFVINNKDLMTKMEHHGIFTTQIKNLHLPQANLTMYQKGVYYSGIRVFNGIPTDIKDISDSPVKFKTGLKHFLYSYLHSFYTLEEYYNR